MACVPRWLSAGAWPGRRARTRCQAEAAAWCCPRMDSSSAWDIRPAIASGEGWFTTESLQVLAWLPLLYVSGQAADSRDGNDSEDGRATTYRRAPLAALAVETAAAAARAERAASAGAALRRSAVPRLHGRASAAGLGRGGSGFPHCLRLARHGRDSAQPAVVDDRGRGQGLRPPRRFRIRGTRASARQQRPRRPDARATREQQPRVQEPDPV